MGLLFRQRAVVPLSSPSPSIPVIHLTRLRIPAFAVNERAVRVRAADAKFTFALVLPFVTLHMIFRLFGSARMRHSGRLRRLNRLVTSANFEGG